ncbi:MAG: DUF559 domain-containing protein [FCB group bacterium]|nr:DUF559 domain-containing protein [FCB group bacterium]
MRRIIRNNPTLWEHKLWQYFKGRQLDRFKFRRQHGFRDTWWIFTTVCQVA